MGICEERTTTQNGEPTANGCGSADGFDAYDSYGNFFVDDIINFFNKNDDSPNGFSFLNACNKHDKCYGKCGKDKTRCDSDFRDDMQKECNKINSKGGTRKKCEKIAKVYHFAVKRLGHEAYETAQNTFCKWQQCCEQ